MKDFPLVPIAGTKNKLFVKPPKKEEKKSKGGIILVEQKEDKAPTSGTIIAISEQDENGVKPILKVGDFVIFAEYSAKEAEYNGEEYLVIKEHDVFAKVIN